MLRAEVPADRVTRLRVAGVDCQEEVSAIKAALVGLEGVRSVETSILTGVSIIEHTESVGEESLIRAIRRAGLKARPKSLDDQNSAHAHPPEQWPVLISGGFFIGGLLLAWLMEGGLAERALFAAAIVAGGTIIFPKAIRTLRQWRMDMNVLMTIAVVGAVAIGEWAEGAAVVFLFSLSEWLESLSVGRARRAIQSLLDGSPSMALCRRNGRFETVPVSEISAGEIIAGRVGERIALDGIVTSGRGSIDQSPITGESVPVEKAVGAEVFAGSIVSSGSVEIRVTKVAGETILSRIVSMVEEAQSRKAPSQRFVDVFAAYYTPAVVVGAALVCLFPPLLFGGDWNVWFYRSLVLLVIACPCALVIATPVSIVSGLTSLARRGVLMKGGVYLELVGRLRAVALDKTGTVTEGKPRVLAIRPWDEGEDSILRVAAAIDAHSTHPLATAIVDACEERGYALDRALDFASRDGRGAEGTIDGHRYFVGNPRFADELGVSTPALASALSEIERKGQTAVVVGHRPQAGCRGGVLGILAIGDAVRENVRGAIEDLRRAGVETIVMLSGDNQQTVDVIAREAGIEVAHGNLLPENKIEKIHMLLHEHRFVGMVGDGINDAPALAAATVGMAMGMRGTDAAIEVADVTLMQDELGKVAEAIRAGRRTLRIIRFNIFFALTIKAVFLLLAVFGLAGLWAAIAADTGATLLVIANSLRLLREPRRTG